MGFKELIMFLVFCSYFHVFSASSSLRKTLPSSSVSLQRTGLGDKGRYEQGKYMIHSRKNIAHGTAGGGGSSGGTINGGGSNGGTSQSGGNGESGSATSAQGGTAVIPVYAAAGAANNNRHHSGGASHNSLGLATLLGTALASLGLPLYLSFG